MAAHQSQTHFARPSRRGQGRPRAPAQGRAARRAARAADPAARAATTTATSRRATRAVATSTTTAWSTSCATRTASRRRSSASSTTRTAPPTSRCCATPTASAATSSRRAAWKSARSCCRGAEAPIKAGNTLPIRNIPVGSTIHCIEMLPGKGAQIARSAGTSVHAAGARRHLRPGAHALGRNAQDPHRLPRHDRRSRQRRAQPAPVRQGRCEALARHPPDGARRGDEPGRPPARRRRRPTGEGQPSGVAVGHA